MIVGPAAAHSRARPCRRQLGHIPGGMDRDPLQDIHQPCAGIDVVQAVRQHQALEDPDSFRTRLDPAEQPVAVSQRDRSDAPFEMIRVDGHVGGLETDLKAASVVAGVNDGLEQGIRRRTRHVICHGIAPSPEVCRHFVTPLTPGVPLRVERLRAVGSGGPRVADQHV